MLFLAQRTTKRSALFLLQHGDAEAGVEHQRVSGTLGHLC